MAKKEAKIKAIVKIQIPGGKATPAPPVGTALGPHGINLGQFVLQFNEKTKELNGLVVPALVTVFDDRSFSFILKSPPASVLLKKAASIAKGASLHRAGRVATVTRSQIEEIANVKFADLNTANLDSAFRIISGTAKSVGIEIVD